MTKEQLLEEANTSATKDFREKVYAEFLRQARKWIKKHVKDGELTNNSFNTLPPLMRELCIRITNDGWLSPEEEREFNPKIQR